MVNPNLNKDDSISLWQLFAILENSILGTGLLNIAKTVSKVSGQNAWISTLLAGLIIIPFLWCYSSLSRRFPGHTLVDYSTKIVGKLLGNMANISYISFEILIAALVLRIMADFISTWFLPNTPIESLLIITLFLVIYMSQGGIRTIARTSEIILFLVAPFIILLIPPATRIEINNLKPVLQSGYVSIIKGSIPALYAFYGFEVLFIASAFISDTKKIFRTSATCISINVVFYTLVVIAIIGVMGTEILKYINYPTIYYIKSERFPFFERVDLFFAFFWTFNIFMTIGIAFYSAVLGISQLLSLKPKYGRNVGWILAIAVYFIAKTPKNSIEVTTYIQYISYIGIAVAMLMPAILAIVATIRHIDVKDGGNV